MEKIEFWDYFWKNCKEYVYFYTLLSVLLILGITVRVEMYKDYYEYAITLGFINLLMLGIGLGTLIRYNKLKKKGLI